MTFYETLLRRRHGPRWLGSCVDPGKAAAYAANWGADRLIVGDVAKLTTADLPGVADLAWASFPCQDLSLAGDRGGLDAARSGSFWLFCKLMHGLRVEGRAPRMIVLENVCGLVTSHGGKDFEAISSAIEERGDRAGAVVIDASLFVPQSRERVFVVAVDANAYIPATLVADGPTTLFHPPALAAACGRQRDPLWWRLPIPPKRNSTLAGIVEDELQGVRWHDSAESERLLEATSPFHQGKIVDAKGAGHRVAWTAFRRMRDIDGERVSRTELRFDGIAGCFRVPTGGSSRQFVVVIENGGVRSRLLSPREAARLMGLPDEYKLPANVNEALGLMGEGVAVPAVRFLAENLLEPLLSISPCEARDATLRGLSRAQAPSNCVMWTGHHVSVPDNGDARSTGAVAA
jgi:DNA (cytosine-5)-methyltransferase 1